MLEGNKEFGIPRRACIDARALLAIYIRGASNAWDVIDASVVILARERRDSIVTSDRHDLRRLDAAGAIIQI